MPKRVKPHNLVFVQTLLLDIYFDIFSLFLPQHLHTLKCAVHWHTKSWSALINPQEEHIFNCQCVINGHSQCIALEALIQSDFSCMCETTINIDAEGALV